MAKVSQQEPRKGVHGEKQLASQALCRGGEVSEVGSKRSGRWLANVLEVTL